MKPNTLWLEKQHAERAMNEARKRLSLAQQEFARTQREYKRAQLRWIEAAGHNHRPWDDGTGGLPA